MSAIFKLTGMKELDRTLGQLPQAVRRQVALKALRDGGEPIARMARTLAPKDEYHMSESIAVLATLARSQRGDKGAVAPVEMHVGPGQHPQAITQEFGTFKEPAQPFMTPAWAAQKLVALGLIGAHLGLEIAKMARRLAGGLK